MEDVMATGLEWGKASRQSSGTMTCEVEEHGRGGFGTMLKVLFPKELVHVFLRIVLCWVLAEELASQTLRAFTGGKDLQTEGYLFAILGAFGEVRNTFSTKGLMKGLSGGKAPIIILQPIDIGSSLAFLGVTLFRIFGRGRKPGIQWRITLLGVGQFVCQYVWGD
jgi:hypothetical protein